MARTNSWTETLVDWVDGRLRQNRFSNMWLGGGAGADGGSSYRPIDGQLTQRHVCYDTSEEASPCSPSGFSSLVDNLRRIRYRQEPATWFGAETTSGLKITIKPGLWYPSTTEYCAFAGGDSPTFTLPGALDRIDTVYIDPSGILHIQRGAPAVSPTITLPPIASGIPLWAVYLPPTASGVYFQTCSGYYAGQAYIERDLRPFLNLGGGGAVASGVLPAATAEGQALVSSAALEWVADTTPLWKGEHSFEAGIAFVGLTTENSIIIPDAQIQAFHIIDTGATEFLRIDTYNEHFIIDPAGVGINVGIGVNPPDQELHVHGGASVTIKLTNDDTGIAGNVGFDIGIATDESVYLWNYENTELVFGTNNTCRMTILAGGDVGIATATPEGKLDVAYGANVGAMTLLLGADIAASTRTNVTSKRTVIGAYHYTNAEEPVGMMYVFSSSLVSRLDIGGGHVLCNAATEVSIYTAANRTTTTGTKRFSVSSTGAITVTGPSLEVPDGWWVGIGAATERIVIDSAGYIAFRGCNVSIGLAIPNQKLTIEGTIDLKEQAAANADTASYGQIWVKNTDPNELWFTDDTGTDVQLGVGGGLPNVAGAGYALVSDGVNSWVADQTPAWTGEHSFGAAIAFTGATGVNAITIPDNLANALHIIDAGDADVYLQIVTTTGSEEVIFNAGGDDVDFTIQTVGVADALQVRGSDGQITLGILTAGFTKSSAGGVLSVATEVVLAELAGYAQGSIIRGGAADWEALVHPGAAGYALISDATDIVWNQTPLWSGVHTHAANIILDDGAGNSPQLQFIGGSNNDTVLMYLNDNAVAGDSDLIIRLCATDTGSRLIIWDSTPATVAYIDADGNADFVGHLAVGAGASITSIIVGNIRETFTNTAGARYGFRSLIDVDPSGASSAPMYALEGNLQVGTAQAITGSLVAVRASLSVDNGVAATISNAFVFSMLMDMEDATVTNTYGAYIQTSSIDTGSIQNAYGAYIAQGTVGAGAITNLYGLYIASINAGSALNYAIHTNVGLVHFGDQVEIIGNAAADIQLIVKGVVAQSASLVQFQNSTTAIFFDSGDGLANSAVVWNEQGLDIDFRVETVGQANALFVQGSDGYVGVGVAPTALLHIEQTDTDTYNTAAGNEGDLFIVRKNNSVTAGQMASLAFKVSDNNGAANALVILNAVQVVSATSSADFTVQTRSVGVFAERFRVTHDGNIGIGTAGPAAKCHIDQISTTAAIPVLTLDQADISDGFINFIGSDRGVITQNISSLTSVRVELGGVVYRLALYVDA